MLGSCWRGFIDIAQLLVESGADIDVQNESGNTCLNVCAYKGFEEIACVSSSFFYWRRKY